MGVVLVILGGLVFGSFLNVVVWRVPRGESIVSPPSHCGACGTRLKPLDLVPVLSYLFLRGRCRYCGSRISLRYPVVEMLAAGLLTGLYLHTGLSWAFGLYGVLFLLLIAVSFIDLDHQIIPDSLVIIGAVVGLGMNIAGVETGFVDGLLGALTGGGTLLLIALIALYGFKKEGLGGGDIKLMAMAGLYLGWRMTLLSLFLAVCAAAVAGVTLLALRKKKRSDAIPLGPFLSLGIVAAVFWGERVLSWYLTYFW
jgi:leader peptidase (prepilin peptidase)/N-methyltransferase